VTAVPMAFCAAAPRGGERQRRCRKECSDVMITGRNRILTAERVASTAHAMMHWSLMNWMIRMAFW